jgi:hypothetical protein
MKKLLLILLASISIQLVYGQAKRNFHYQEHLYEISVDTPKVGRTSFGICWGDDSCSSTPVLIWPFEKDIFRKEFIEGLSKLDTSLSKTAGAEKELLADSLYNWCGGLFKPAPKPLFAEQMAEIKSVMEKDDERTRIGVLMLNTAPLQTNTSTPDTKLKIKELNASIVNGVIAKRSLFVTLEDGRVFFNRQSPVSFPKFFRRKDDLLSIWNGDLSDTTVLKLGQVLTYVPFGKLYYPENEEINLLPDDLHNRDTLSVSSSLNNMIEMSIYSDMLGILGEKANGLIQTEIAGNFISNTGNVKNADITFHHFMRPYLRLSRFDSKFRSIDSTHIGKGPSGDTLDRTYLSQVSYLQAGLKFNVVKFGIGINQVLQINGGADINLTNADSVYKKDITFFNYYGELNYVITRLKNFGMDASLRWLWQYLSSANSNEIHIQNRGAEPFFSPTFSLYYFPSQDKYASSKIYFRFTYMANTRDGKSNYSQFQLGYKTSLNLK